jgi:hypothetical protein
MSNTSYLHRRIRPAAVYFYRFGGLFSFVVAYMMAQEPRSTDPFMRWMELSLNVMAVGFAAYCFVKPLLVYEIQIDPNTITLSRWAGRQNVVIERKNLVSYGYFKGRSFDGYLTEELTIYTSEARYVLDATEYAGFDQVKQEITKGVKRKY